MSTHKEQWMTWEEKIVVGSFVLFVALILSIFLLGLVYFMLHGIKATSIESFIESTYFLYWIIAVCSSFFETMVVCLAASSITTDG